MVQNTVRATAAAVAWAWLLVGQPVLAQDFKSNSPVTFSGTDFSRSAGVIHLAAGNSGQIRGVSSGTSDTLLRSDGTVQWNSAAASPKTENIPSCTSAYPGETHRVVDGLGNAATYAISVAPPLGSTISGQSTYPIYTNRKAITILCDGVSNWIVIGEGAYPVGTVPIGDGYSTVPGPPPGHGAVVVYPSLSWTSDPTSTTALTVVMPPDIPSSITSPPWPCVSTHSQCLAEALAVAQAYGKSVEIVGPGENQLGGGGTSTTYPYIASDVPINFGPLSQRVVRAYGINLTFSSAVTGCGLTINTINDGGRVSWNGLIVYKLNTPTSSSHAVCFVPTTDAPVERFPIMINTPIYIGGVAFGTAAPTQNSAGDVVFFDSTTASISNMDITFGELNCNGPAGGSVANTGIRINHGAGGNSFFNNKITVYDIHQCVNGIMDGDDPVMSISNKNNIFTVLNTSPNVGFEAAKGIAFREYGNSNIINLMWVNANEGPYNTAIQFEAGSGAAAGGGAIGDTVYVHADSPTLGTGWVDNTASGLGGHDLTFNGYEVLGANLRTWSPTLAFGGSSTGITYTTRTGVYQQRGKEVIANFNIVLSSKGAQTGSATISGLPLALTQNGTFSGSCPITFYNTMLSMVSAPWGYIAASATSFSVESMGVTGNGNVTDANFTNTTQLSGTCVYLTN